MCSVRAFAWTPIRTTRMHRYDIFQFDGFGHRAVLPFLPLSSIVRCRYRFALALPPSLCTHLTIHSKTSGTTNASLMHWFLITSHRSIRAINSLASYNWMTFAMLFGGTATATRSPDRIADRQMSAAPCSRTFLYLCRFRMNNGLQNIISNQLNFTMAETRTGSRWENEQIACEISNTNDFLHGRK